MVQKLETRCEKTTFILFKIQSKKPFFQKIAFMKNLYFQKSLLGGLIGNVRVIVLWSLFFSFAFGLPWQDGS